MRLIMKTMICEVCCCVDSKDNPILEILDEDGFVEQRICMMCYSEQLEDIDG